jgi:hypothetical protein
MARTPRLAFLRGTGVLPRAACALVLGALLVLHSCGIESYYYLPEVPAGNITTSANQWASVSLPQITMSYFTHFALYYRIYLSYEQIANIGDLSGVNATLNSDYRYLSTYTSSSTTTSVNVASIMSSRGYQPLFFQTASGSSISNDLLSSTSGALLRIDFSVAGSVPAITYPGGAASLIRSNGDGVFTPLPDRYFRDTPELKNPAYINSTTNADVVNASGTGITSYAFVSLYIVSVGLNEQTYTPIFSIPTFVGVFRLP